MDFVAGVFDDFQHQASGFDSEPLAPSVKLEQKLDMK